MKKNKMNKQKFLLGYSPKIYLIIGLLFALIFSFVSAIIPFMNSFSKIDLEFSESIESMRDPILNKIMLFFSFLGDEYVILIVLIVVVFVLFIYKNKKYILLLLSSVIFGEVFIWILKNIIQRPRPISLNALAFESSFSFPSGHAFIAISFYLLLIFLYYRKSKNKTQKILSIVLGVLLVTGIGFSRVYLGVHWLSDILVSYVFGFLWIIVLINIFRNKIKLEKD